MNTLEQRIYIKKNKNGRKHLIQEYLIYDILDHHIIGKIKLQSNQIIKFKIKTKSRHNYIASESLLILIHSLQKDIFCKVSNQNTAAIALFTTFSHSSPSNDEVQFNLNYNHLKGLNWYQVYLNKLKKYIHASSSNHSLINLPARLKPAGKDMFNRDFKLHPLALKAWIKMQKQAHKQGVNLQVISAFRSLSYQNQLIIKKMNNGLKLDDILKVNTLAGFSEHHSGCAIDIGSKDCAVLETEFEDTLAFKWLNKNAHQFGFYLSYPKNNNLGIIYEPWHWCFKPSN